MTLEEFCKFRGIDPPVQETWHIFTFGFDAGIKAVKELLKKDKAYKEVLIGA